MLRISSNLSGLAGVVAAGAIALSLQSPAQAQAAFGSYVGAGAAVGLSDDDNGDGDGVSFVISGRYNILELPISIRGQAFLLGDGSAFVPTVSYDYPLNFQTNVYVGAGISLPSGGEPSPVGDQVSFVIQPGVDYFLPGSNLVVFGNAVFALNGFSDGGTATSVQGGVGVQF
ncbi:outer membrane beta-barrel protein [Romeria aff. gracilis LEGE 07310]|uniref:Outer membrane beta-barrel protein n=1 Tax=Vasconcelosia minhoensis LEGE 07310 TaxID=915328 RepID=A0A8J7AF96_9CYAN|nr:outer membrane beta-barrel protein [Romeria gracilis]MBE9078014.1 outer membrane beta-barrel protein [Romeria aff. gracilis LEGE 07310]